MPGKFHTILLLAFGLKAILLIPLSGQEIPDSMMMQEYPVENPLSRPEIGLGTGTFSFFGDVNSNTRMLVGGQAGFRLNVASFLDTRQYYRLNFFLIRGVLTANRLYEGNNLNFNTDITSFGATLVYDFAHFLPREVSFRPFVAAGVETFQFNPKGDIYGPGGVAYPWLENDVLFDPGQMVPRDYIYETNLRNPDWSTLDNYSKFSFALPLEAGVSLQLAQRVSLRLSTSWHISLTDNLDNFNSIRSEEGGNRMTDVYRYTSLTLHLDPFSESRVMKFINLYEEVETDPMYLEDEDGDFVLDFFDECLETPAGVPVDSLGCPQDGDRDGVPDYLDEEPDSPFGASVSNTGIMLSEEDLLTPGYLADAVERKMLEYYRPREGPYSQATLTGIYGIPDKFREFDRDRDGYISFDELLLAIDRYFDYQTGLGTEDIYSLINFFFAQ